MDRQPVLEGASLRLRPLEEADREALYEAACDPLIWAGHPAKTRHQRAVFDPYFSFLLSTGETLVVTDKATGRVIGCSRYYTSPDRPGQVGVGFTFLVRDHWGGRTNFELKQLMFDHVFAHYDEVWLDIGPDNIRSQKASAKLGAEYVYEACLDFGTGPADYKCYRVTRAAWRRVGETHAC